MARPSIDEGFRFWRNEVETFDNPEKVVPYIPVIALVGVYVTFAASPDALTSYSWRQAVLNSDDAMQGFRQSLSSFIQDRADDMFELPIEFHEPEEHAAKQFICAHQSLMDGLPDESKTIPENEWFLAQTLGFARHDHGVMLDPLRLIEGGDYAFRSNYPLTADFVSENT